MTEVKIIWFLFWVFHFGAVEEIMKICFDIGEMIISIIYCENFKDDNRWWWDANAILVWFVDDMTEYYMLQYSM